MKDNTMILWFDQIGLEDIPRVGGKNASLGEMRRNISSRGVNIPNGFAITAHTYRYLLETSGINREIQRILEGLDTHDVNSLQQRGQQIRSLICNAELPKDLEAAIVEAYHSFARSMVRTRMLLCAAPQQRRTYPTLASRDSKRLSSTCAGPRRS